MAIKLGTSDISKVYLGSTEVSKIYLGATEIYSGGFGTYVDAMITRANALSYTLPSNATLTDLQTRLATIGDTALNKLDVLHIYSPDAGTMDFFTLNVVAPTTIQATLVNSPTSSKLGVLTNGSNNYIDTGANPNSLSNYSLNDAQISVFLSQDVVDNGGFNNVSFILDSATRLGFRINTGSNHYSHINNDGNVINSNGATLAAGFKTLQRTTSTTFKSYQNGVLNASMTGNSTTIPNINMFLGGRNNNGTFDGAQANRFVAFCMGSSITTTEMATINTQIAAFYGR